MPRTILNQDYASLAEKQIKACIHCGMCLPACPTYAVTGNEGHSPRGRLYLINDLLGRREVGGGKREESPTSHVPLPPSLEVEYLDACLSCSACETVCPSGVQYIDLLEHARKDLGQTNYNQGFVGKIRRFVFEKLLPNRSVLRFLASLAESFSFLAKLMPGLQDLIKLKPELGTYQAIEIDFIYKSEHNTGQIVSMPLGCVMDTYYNEVHWQTIEVLNKFGYDVYIPETQCCGALASHSGEYELGKEQLDLTLGILKQKNYPVVMNSAGCGAFVKNHSQGVYDLIEVLLNAPITPSFKSFEQEITYHPACHINHQQGLAYDYLDLLKKIPGLQITMAEETDLCCGSAGFYNLIQPEMAAKIGERKASFLRHCKEGESPPRNDGIVVTANPGCISQIQAHIGPDYQVIHPVSLLLSAISD